MIILLTTKCKNANYPHQTTKVTISNQKKGMMMNLFCKNNLQRFMIRFLITLIRKENIMEPRTLRPISLIKLFPS